MYPVFLHHISLLHMKLFRAAIGVLLVVLSGVQVEARVLSQQKRECPKGGSFDYETWTLIQDDCTGVTYTLYVSCTGTHRWNIARLWRVVPSTMPVEVSIPANFWDSMATADYSTWGAPIGVAFVAVVNGVSTPVGLYTPDSPLQVAELEASWSCQPNCTCTGLD